MQTIHIASDHAGYALKEHLVQFLAQKGINVVDDGTHSTESCDYPVLAHKLCAAVEKEQGTGILICGTGIGISIAANRHSGIRAALCATELQARLSRQHNNAKCALPRRAHHRRGAGSGHCGSFSGWFV